MLQCVAACCSVLQCVRQYLKSDPTSMMQRDAVCCSVLQVCCSVLNNSSQQTPLMRCSVCGSVLQCVAVCCSMLQRDE